MPTRIWLTKTAKWQTGQRRLSLLWISAVSSILKRFLNTTTGHTQYVGLILPPHPIQNSFEQLSTNYTNEKLQQEVRIFLRCTRALCLIIMFTGKSVQRPRVRIGARGMRNPTKGFCRIAQRLDSRRDAVAKKTAQHSRDVLEWKRGSFEQTIPHITQTRQ